MEFDLREVRRDFEAIVGLVDPRWRRSSRHWQPLAVVHEETLVAGFGCSRSRTRGRGGTSR